MTHLRKSLVVAMLAGLSLACDGTGVQPVSPVAPEQPATKTKKQPVGGTIHTDTFTQGNLVGGYADILFVVDNSCSMSPHQQNLAKSFDTFINWIQQENVDFHIAVTTTDNDAGGQQGAFVGTPAVIDNTTPNLADAFKAAVKVGINGSAKEKGFGAAVAALSEPLKSTVNAGFLRENAKLYVIFVTDEDDQSTVAAADLLATLHALKADPKQVHLTTIGGTAADDLAGCSYETTKYNDVVALTGGLFGSICQADFGTTLQQLAFEVTSASGEYFLTRIPDPATITVAVDGVLQTSDRWTYHSGTNSVELHAQYIPQPGAQIVITYEVAGTGAKCVENGTVAYDLDGGEDSWKFYCIEIPAGTTKLLVHLWDGKGDADLYVKLGGKPGENDYDHRSVIEEQDETLLLENPAAGTYWIGVYGFHRYDDVNMQPIWIGTGGGNGGGGGGGGGNTGVGHVMLSGVFYDTPGSDTVEEYVELHNPTSDAVSLEGWTLADNAASWSFPQGFSIPAGGFVVVAKDAAGFQALFGRAPTVAGLNISLNNTGDWLLLTDSTGASVDYVAWENAAQGWTLNAPTGGTLVRADLSIDSDSVADWSVVTPADPRG